MSTEQQTGDDETTEPTPGPWTYSQDSAEVRAENGTRTLAKLDGTDGSGRSAAETHHNGRLMAAAPALSEALRSLFWATAELLDHATGQKGTGPARVSEAAERSLSEAALALDTAGEPGPSDGGGWAGALAQQE